MTTEFDSFDASQLRAFAESELGARNPARVTAIILMVVIDESTPYEDSVELYLSDLADFLLIEQAYRANGIFLKTMVMHPQSTQTGPLSPPGEALERFTPIPVGVPGTVLEYTDALRGVMLDAEDVVFADHKATLIVTTDESGSITRGNLQPTIRDFLGLIERQVFWPKLVLDDQGELLPLERWLQAFKQMLT